MGARGGALYTKNKQQETRTPPHTARKKICEVGSHVHMHCTIDASARVAGRVWGRRTVDWKPVCKYDNDDDSKIKNQIKRKTSTTRRGKKKCLKMRKSELMEKSIGADETLRQIIAKQKRNYLQFGRGVGTVERLMKRRPRWALRRDRRWSTSFVGRSSSLSWKRQLICLHRWRLPSAWNYSQARRRCDACKPKVFPSRLTCLAS